MIKFLQQEDGSTIVPNATNSSITVPNTGNFTTADTSSINAIDTTAFTDAVYRQEVEYKIPKFRLGSVVTYKSSEVYKMGKVIGAIEYNNGWYYKIDSEEDMVAEKNIKEEIFISNQEFIEGL